MSINLFLVPGDATDEEIEKIVDEMLATEDEVEKGGEGSGEQEGHPFRGNQYTQGVSETEEEHERQSSLFAHEHGRDPEFSDGTEVEDDPEATMDKIRDWPDGDSRWIGELAVLNIADNHMEGMVMYDEDEMIGIAAYRDKWNNTLDENTMYVEDLAVCQPKKGYGESIFTQLCKVAAERDVGLSLSSVPKARKFYSRMGMERDFDDHGSLTGYTMSREAVAEVAKKVTPRLKKEEEGGEDDPSALAVGWEHFETLSEYARGMILGETTRRRKRKEVTK